MAEDGESRYLRQRAKQIQSAKDALRYVSSALLFMGVRTVCAEFNNASSWGCGLDEVQFDPPPPTAWPDGLLAVIDSAFRDLVSVDNDEIIESRSGSITLDTTTGEVNIKYK